MSDSIEEIQKKLADPFESSDIEWRVQRSGKGQQGGGWAVVIAYVTNRAVQQRLDDVFGIDGWENELIETSDKKGFLCGIKVRFESGWVTKWDASEYTNIEALKGAVSGSMKRAAVQLGIGRYLYNLDEEWVKCTPVSSRFDVKHNYIKLKTKGSNASEDAQWETPKLPAWAMPSAKAENYISKMESAKDMEQLKSAFEEAYKYSSSFNRKDLGLKFTKIKDRKKEELEPSELEKKNKTKEMLGYVKTQISAISKVSDKKQALTTLEKIITKVKESCLLAGIESTEFEQLINKSIEDRKNAK